MNLRETSLSQAFPPEEGRSVALVGAGGKTSTLRRMAEEDAARGHSVLNLTTTKMYFDQPPGEALTSPEEPVPAGEIRYYGRSGEEDESGIATRKFLPPEEEALARILARPPADRVLIEADGARQGWVKIHRSYEPVVPDAVDARLTVLNLRGVGRSPSEEWIHRWEDWTGLYSPEETFGVGRLEDLLARDHGYRAPAGQQRWLLLIGFPADSGPPSDPSHRRSVLNRFSHDFWFGWDRTAWWLEDRVYSLREHA